MQVILDTSALVLSERRSQRCSALMETLRQKHNIHQASISVITVMELTHGVYRARTEEQRLKRHIFLGEIMNSLDVFPVTAEIAHRAGRIEGEQAALGVVIDTADLLIGTTALVTECCVLTLNVRHFERIPDLQVVPLDL